MNQQINVLGKNSCKFQKLLKTASKLILDLKGYGGKKCHLDLDLSSIFL